MEYLNKEDYEEYKILHRWSPSIGACLLMGIKPNSVDQNSSPSKIDLVHRIILDSLFETPGFRLKEENGKYELCPIGFICWAKDNSKSLKTN